MEALLRDAKIERMNQAEILEELRARYYPGEVPVRMIWHQMADRRERTITSVRGAGFARG
jgi:hypothetical protein